MTQSTTQTATPTRPWGVSALPDFFGVHLWLDGTRFYIPNERLNTVIVALCLEKERQATLAGVSAGAWLDELRQIIRGERGELGETPAQVG